MLLQFDAIDKAFPGVQALSGVSFSASGGSVHALCGENGAGKSTLLKVLSGVIAPDSGCLRIDGEEIRFGSPSESLRAGVSVIYQELHLAPEMTVADNILLGHLSHRAGLLNRSENKRRCQELLATIGIQIDSGRKVGSLSLAQRQMVEIAKALSRDARVIAFDEPTSALSAREVETLFGIINELRKQGRIVLYVSHRMEEILRICDACTILRDGKHVATFPTMHGVTANDIVSRMVGRDIADVYGYRDRPYSKSSYRVSGVVGSGEPQSLEVHGGEVVGIFGLVGAGRTELLQSLFGLAGKRKAGEQTIGENTLKVRSPRDAIRAGVVLCPEDRKREGIFAVRSVQENINVSARPRHAHLGTFVNDRWERRNARGQIDRLSIKTPSPHQPIVYLSGGNQQKAILGRWLSAEISVLLLDEPTRGVDVGAKREIYDIVFELAEKGAAVVLVSSDLPEVLGVSDRVLVMRDGNIVAQFHRSEATESAVLAAALPI